ncbi:TIGR03086 family protein [Nocardioides sp. GY 10113]|uniref:TIGR03086 family metal-binding protein n=1 Tax=Nocardioides sp. GY 10113 TaxID=2569761 RepID=UPI0010A910E6|nr:TIGR03086 family metal-binding protein [Nocardioides sp. GY 10113]TIC79244.1 TIGR03086 family protein [Nocardioides sp. GY 10113]
MDVGTLHHRSVEYFADRINAVTDDQWDRPTPCAAWTVRDLANHVTAENLWAVPLMGGATIEEVGDRFSGDLLGADPIQAALDAARAAVTAVAEGLARGGTVHLSFGETPKEEYAAQLAADHLIHGWDLAAATGQDRRLDPQVVRGIADWFAAREELYRGAGAVTDRRALSGDPQRDLLARFGRDADWGPAHATLIRFNAAFGAADLETALALVTDDIVFEATSPAPDGQRWEGREAVRAAWAEVMGTPGMTFTEEESFVAGDRGVVRWRYAWAGSDPGHVRGTDVLRFRDGLVSEKLSYVKG